MSRDKSIDILKGFAIILMVFGHCPSIVRPLIFSFHMPLFFFVSGYLYKDKTIKQLLKSTLYKVILPYLITCFIVWFFKYIASGQESWGLNILIGNGENVGPLWFLVCYAVSQIYFWLGLKSNRNLFASVLLILWICAYFYRENFGLLPFNILNAIPATFCMFLGYQLKDIEFCKKIFTKRNIAMMLVTALLSSVKGTLTMASFVYPFWAISIIAAMYVTFVCYWIINKYCLTSKWGGISIFGTNSLFFLCAHSVDYLLNISPSVCNYFFGEYGEKTIVLFPTKMLFIVLSFLLLSRIRIIKNIYLIK